MARYTRQAFRGIGVGLVLTAVAAVTSAQQGAQGGEWRHYGGDEANTR